MTFNACGIVEWSEIFFPETSLDSLRKFSEKALLGSVEASSGPKPRTDDEAMSEERDS